MSEKTVHPALDALWEIGVEEIPSSYVPPALAFMKKSAEDYFAQKKLSHGPIQTLGTPRRLVLYIPDLARVSQQEMKEVSGPALKAAKDASGNWTPAALGFARSTGVLIDKLTVRETPKGPYLFCVKKIPGEKSEILLPRLFAEILEKMPFPKKMVWNDSGAKFARPLRSLLVLYGKRALKLEWGGVRSSSKTFLLSHLASKKITVASPKNYVEQLRNQLILVDPQERRKSILDGAQHLVDSVGGKLALDDALVDEVVWLVESPSCVLGTFDNHYLELPQEVLITVMRKHQKFFPVVDALGKLMPYFVAVRNGPSEYQEIVRKGFERVLLARLYDAKFFYAEDLEKPLSAYLENTKRITVHAKLGSLADKTERLKAIALRFSNELKHWMEVYAHDSLSGAFSATPLDGARLLRAAELAKFDQATKMVY